MDLDPGWKQKVVEKLLLEDEQKGEKKYLLRLKFQKWLNLRASIVVKTLLTF